MKTLYITVSLSLLSVMTPSLATGQEAAVQEEVPAPAAAAPADEWASFSRNDRTIYLIHMKDLTAVDNVTQVRIARVPTQGAADDFSYRLDEYELRCRQNQARQTSEAEFGPDGQEVERYPEADAEWETIRPTSLAAYFKPIACDGAVSQDKPASSIQAFIARGRH